MKRAGYIIDINDRILDGSRGLFLHKVYRKK